MIYIAHYDSPIGNILLTAKDNKLIGLWFENQKYYPNFKEELKEENIPILEKTKNWLNRYFNKENPLISELDLSLTGSEFRITVLQKLMEIPYEKTTTYKAIAEDIAKEKGIESMSAQAIGGAIKRNPISIIVPCHRVIGTNGSLTGYAGGLSRKEYLLKLEGAIDKNFRATI